MQNSKGEYDIQFYVRFSKVLTVSLVMTSRFNKIDKCSSSVRLFIVVAFMPAGSVRLCIG